MPQKLLVMFIIEERVSRYDHMETEKIRVIEKYTTGMVAKFIPRLREPIYERTHYHPAHEIKEI